MFPQMFESDGSAMIYWHALGDVNSTDISGNGKHVTMLFVNILKMMQLD